MLSAQYFFEQSESRVDHNRLIALINSLSDGFLSVTQAGKIELCNSVALNLLDTNSLTGKQISQAMPLLSPDSNTVDPIALVGDKPNFNSRDYSLRFSDGDRMNIWVAISAVRPGFSGGKGGYVIVFRDITDEKKRQDERDEFISVASHELRNPVAIAEGSLSNAILLSGKGTSGDAMKQVLQTAHQQMVFLGNLINDLAMVSRAEQGHAAEKAEEFDVSEVISGLVSDYSAQAQKKGLVMAVDSNGPSRVFANKLYVREILQNFISNSIKYTPAGTIKISSAADDKGVHISVTDQGIGISPQDQPKLFSKFFRSQDSRVRSVSGTGLGLYISNKLAGSMGCTITFVSQQDNGSRFTLNLSAAKTPPQPVAQSAAKV